MRITLLLIFASFIAPALSAQVQTAYTAYIVDFGQITVGLSSETLLPIINTGCDSMEIYFLKTNPPFEVGTPSKFIDPGETDSLPLSFQPSVPGFFSEFVPFYAISAGDTVADTLMLEGTGITPPASVTTPSSEGINLMSYPNPASSSLGISYTLGSPCRAQLMLYDAIGNEVANLVDETEQAGEHVITVHSAKFPSGQYICRLTATTADGQAPVASSMISILH